MIEWSHDQGARPVSPHRFGSDRVAHPPEERILADAGLYPLAGYLAYWRAHIDKALETVPAERLFVVRTDRIAAEAERIAEFGGFAAAIDRSRIQEYSNPYKRPVLREIPRAYLDQQVRLHCEPMVSRLFPDVPPVADANLGEAGAASPSGNASLRATLLQNPPRFHCWGGVWQIGGCSPQILDLIESTLRAAGLSGGVAYETGVGLSSVWLLSLGLREVHSFCNDEGVCDRITSFLQDYPVERGRWHCHVGSSQLTLPPHALAKATETGDFCLIDGGHGLEEMFNDFVYFNYILKPGGLLAVDDLQIGSCRLLVELLVVPNVGYEIVDRRDKVAVLRKKLRWTPIVGQSGALFKV